MGPCAATLCWALLGAPLLLSAATLPILGGLEEDCSQPGVGCTVRNSNCFDLSWLHPYDWTPVAPSSLAVTAGIGVDRSGRRVPVLQIAWTLSMDSSILNLQGVELSLFEQQSNTQRCVQLQFTNRFPSQRNPDGGPWQFHYDKFEVSPGHRYHVTVQHLPKLAGVNHKSMEVYVPGCDDEQMIQTDACCDLGLCWFPNISVMNSGRNLTVAFSPRRGADRYGVEVNVRVLQIKKYQYIDALQRSAAERMNVTFFNIGAFEECLYNVSVWADMASCSNDCIRQYYAPVCDTKMPPTPEPAGRWYLWSAAILLTVVMSAGLAVFCKDRICGSEVKKEPPPGPDPIPDPVRKKVWLVYSADHAHYIDAVIRLADFLQLAWGLDVALDRLDLHKIGMMGAMPWLSHQKSEIERTKGTILILCSRGAQEKWTAIRNGQRQRVTLRQDREHTLGDLFTPALMLLLPDFQRSLSYDRYVVAYFENISSPDDIPSPLEICPRYALTEHLQDIFFRIQGQEQSKPNVQLTVCQEDNLSYLPLIRAMETCRNWQEQHVDWFKTECSLWPPEESESENTWEEDADDNNCTKKVHLVIKTPDIDVSLTEPLLSNPGPTLALNPVICKEPPCSRLEPSVREPMTMLMVKQPLLQSQVPPNICRLEPCLAGEHLPLWEIGNHIFEEDIYNQPEQNIQSWEELIEAQRRLFCGHVPGSAGWNSSVEFMDAPGDDQTSNLISEPIEMEEVLLEDTFVTPEVDQSISQQDGHLTQVTDLGYNTMSSGQPDLETIREEAVKLFLQNAGVVRMNHV